MATARAGGEPSDEFMAEAQAQAADRVRYVALCARGALEARDRREAQAGSVRESFFDSLGRSCCQPLGHEKAVGFPSIWHFCSFIWHWPCPLSNVVTEEWRGLANAWSSAAARRHRPADDEDCPLHLAQRCFCSLQSVTICRPTCRRKLGQLQVLADVIAVAAGRVVVAVRVEANGSCSRRQRRRASTSCLSSEPMTRWLDTAA